MKVGIEHKTLQTNALVAQELFKILKIEAIIRLSSLDEQIAQSASHTEQLVLSGFWYVSALSTFRESLCSSALPLNTTVGLQIGEAVYVKLK